MSPITFAYTEKFNIEEMFQAWSKFEQVKFQKYLWTDLWSKIREVVFHKSGFQVSEIGSTWLDALVSMAGLRPFDEHELKNLRGSGTLLNAAWQTTALHGDTQLWAIPWTADTRAIFYWSDMLENAGINPETAFSTHEKMVETLETLQKHYPTPWGVPTEHPYLTIHNVVTWVWAKKAELMTPDGKQVQFAEPLFLSALKDYFSLYRFMPQTQAPLNPWDIDQMFAKREIAVTMSGNWFPRSLQFNLYMKPELFKRIQIALPPGPAYIGGSHLAILSHTSPRDEALALELIDWLLSVENQTWLTQFGTLPVRLDALSEFPYDDNRFLHGFTAALHASRSLPSVSRWSIIEERLGDALSDVWRLVQAGDKPVDQIIDSYMPRMNRRLNMTLDQ